MERFRFPFPFASLYTLSFYLTRAFPKKSPCFCAHAVYILLYIARICDYKPFAWMTKQLLPTVITYNIIYAYDVGKKKKQQRR